MFLILVLLRNPVALARAASIALQGEGAFANYVNSLAGVEWGSGVTRAMILSDLVWQRWPAPGWFGGRYAIAHNVARIELYHASSGIALNGSRGVNFWRKVFGPVTPAGQNPASASRGWFAQGADSSPLAALSDLAAVARKMTGMISYPSLGISQAQEAVECRLVLSRYLRCLLGLLTDALQGRIRGNESRRLLFHCALAAAMVYLFLN
jgi:hypothetical protein